MMNIREINRFDLPYFIETIHQVHQSEMNHWCRELELDDKHLNQTFSTVLAGAGFGYVAEQEGRAIGITVGMISPNVWIPKALGCHQLILWVDPEHRTGRAGYKLIQAYNERCDQLRAQNRIYGYTITASETMFDIDFSRYGYHLQEKVWVSSY